MADLNQPLKSGKRKTQSPRVDLTPMVDLGFLLITFFIFTTTMARANTMEINMPAKSDIRSTCFPEESTITVVPTKDHMVAYYEGAFENGKPAKTVSTQHLREILIAKQKQAAALPATFSAEAHKLHVVIKPNRDCVYEDVVNILDEMSILDVRYYAMDDITMQEQQWLTGRQ